MDADVVIVGGGLAGCATALALLRRGLSVVVVDKAEFPRDKPCGEGLLPHGLELLAQLGCGDVVDQCDGQPFKGILYRCHGVVARGVFEGAQTGRGVQRLLLDDALRKRASAAGARLLNATVRTVTLDNDSATVQLNLPAVPGPVPGESPSSTSAAVPAVPGPVPGESPSSTSAAVPAVPGPVPGESALTARFVIGADGPRSTVRHALGLDGGAPSRPRYAMRRHYRLASAPSLEHVEVNVVHGYELYVTPVARDIVGVAALCEKKTLHDASDGGPEARMDALVARCGPVADRLREWGATVDGRTLACGPLRVRSKDVVKGRAFLVGDAAGYVDAITGEGMSLGLKTALLAANAVADVHDGKCTLDVARARYRSERASAFRDHALLTVGLVELARHPFFAKRAIARLAREPALFTRLLEVNNGTRALTSLGVLDFVKLAMGSRPLLEARP